MVQPLLFFTVACCALNRSIDSSQERCMAKARKPSSPDTVANLKTQRVQGSPAQIDRSFDGKTEAETEADKLRGSGLSQDGNPLPQPISPQERRRLIAETAYRCYQQRDRGQGSPLDDWLKAETEVDRLLAARTHADGTH
jgi:hypothetical protein